MEKTYFIIFKLFLDIKNNPNDYDQIDKFMDGNDKSNKKLGNRNRFGNNNKKQPFERKIKGRFNRAFAKNNEGDYNESSGKKSFGNKFNKSKSSFSSGNKGSSSNKTHRPGKVKRMMNRNKKNSNFNKKR